MQIQTFLSNYREAFGAKAELPIAFWYSAHPVGTTDKINGCFFKSLKQVCAGNPVSLSLETLSCGGGKLYTGFAEMPERVPNFVSLKEKYKQTPEMVLEFISKLGIPAAAGTYLNFVRLDQVDSFNLPEAILFLPTPDILSGLLSWTWFDSNREDAVVTSFASGCSAVVTQAVIENRSNGKRTFLGAFDPSVRPHFDANAMSFVIPMSRFREMYETMRSSCLFDTHAWGKVRERINKTD